MRDLFGSTNFIKFEVLETILSSSDAISRLLYSEENNNLEDYSLDDYLSNIDSYLYGLVMLPIENDKEIKLWIKNYILYLYIPIIEKNSMYIVKSKFVSEIFKLKDNNSRINESIRNFILSDIFNYLSNAIKSREDELQNRLIEFVDSDLFLDYIQNYYNIYKNNNFIIDIYMSNEKLRDGLVSLFVFLK